MTKKLFTPMDKRWDDFVSALIAHLNVRDHPDYEYGFMSDCDGSYRISKNLLAGRYSDVNVTSTISYFQMSGWMCDCEVFSCSPSGLAIPKEEAWVGNE
jgi:hypothetical protein